MSDAKPEPLVRRTFRLRPGEALKVGAVVVSVPSCEHRSMAAVLYHPPQDRPVVCQAPKCDR